MRSTFLTAAIALLLLCSLGGCNWNTASQYDDNNNRLTASDRSAIERNGVHDGSTTGDENHMRQDVWDAGEATKNGVENTTRDIGNGINNATRNTENALRNAAR